VARHDPWQDSPNSVSLRDQNCSRRRAAPDDNVDHNVIAQGHADLISFGRPFLSNPDLVERFRNGWPLAEPAPMSDWSSSSGAKGHTDFPAYGESPIRS